MTAFETIQTILQFGIFTVALIGLVVNLFKNNKK
ncbi:putative holin-like toxin [Gemelliphila palaticanis]|nr:putative holin-like toxin [Gemella palaticanis]